MLFLPQSQKSHGTGNTVDASFQMGVTPIWQATLMAFFFLPSPQSVKAQKSKISHPWTTSAMPQGFSFPANVFLSSCQHPSPKPTSCLWPHPSLQAKSTSSQFYFQNLFYFNCLNVPPFPHLRTLAHAFFSFFLSALLSHPLCLLWKVPSTETLPPPPCLNSNSIHVDSASMP